MDIDALLMEDHVRRAPLQLPSGEVGGGGQGGSAPDARAGGSAAPCRQSPLTRSLPLAQPVPSVLMHEARHLSYLDPTSSASSSRQVTLA